MVLLAAGIVLGIAVTVVAGMVIYCIRIERRHPELLDRIREEMEEAIA